MSAVAIAALSIMGLGVLIVVAGVRAVLHDFNHLGGVVAVPIGAIIFCCGALIGLAKLLDWYCST